MSIGVTELILILAVALLLFGPSRLPGLGKAIGETIKGFKKGINEASEEERVVNALPAKEDSDQSLNKSKSRNSESVKS